jgi:hypothetical protein
MKRSSLAIIFIAAVALSACSSHDALGPQGLVPAEISLSVDSVVLASLGDTAVVTARVLDRDGRQVTAAKLRWTLRDNGVVARDGDGMYRAIGNGRATLVAEIDVGATGVRPAGYWAEGVVDSVVLEVRQRPARLTISPVDTLIGTLGALRQLRATITDARGNALLDAPPALAWRTADPRVLSVDSTGLVRSLGEGRASITVSADHLNGSASFTVNPRLPHTSCMRYAQRKQNRQSCVTLDLVVRERETGR